MIGHSPNVDGRTAGDFADITPETLFDLLSDQHRRYVLESLADSDEPMERGELAEDIAHREHETARSEIPTEAIRSIETSLHHIHLPKLVDAGVVQHGQNGDFVLESTASDRVGGVLSAGNF